MFVALAVVSSAVIFIGYRKFKPKRRVHLRAGDLVLLKKKYFGQFPHLPQNHPMHVEEVNQEMVNVIFMDSKTTHQKTVPLFAIHKVTG